MENNKESKKQQDLDLSEIQNFNFNVLNVFMIYYKHLFNVKKQNETMFDGVDYNEEASVNRQMELLCEIVEIYNNAINDEGKITVVDPQDVDINSCEELYVVSIEQTQVAACQTLYPLLDYVASIDWPNIKWSINPIKTND